MDKPDIKKVIEALKGCSADAYSTKAVNCLESHCIDILRFRDAENILHIRAKMSFDQAPAKKWLPHPYVVTSKLVTLEFYEGNKTHTYEGIDVFHILEATLGFDDLYHLMEESIHHGYQPFVPTQEHAFLPGIMGSEQSFAAA